MFGLTCQESLGGLESSLWEGSGLLFQFVFKLFSFTWTKRFLLRTFPFREADCVVLAPQNWSKRAQGAVTTGQGRNRETTRGAAGPRPPLPRKPRSDVTTRQRPLRTATEPIVSWDTHGYSLVLERRCGLSLGALCTCSSRLLKLLSYLWRGGRPISRKQGDARGRRQFRCS